MIRLMILLFILPFAVASTLSVLGQHVDNEYLRFLEPDPDATVHAPNRAPRSVKSGHFVLVDPTPLRAPTLIIASNDTCRLLGLVAVPDGACDGTPGLCHPCERRL